MRAFNKILVSLVLVASLIFSFASCTVLDEYLESLPTNGADQGGPSDGDGGGNGNNGNNSGEDNGDTGTSGGEYVYGSEYDAITVIEALDIAEGCSSESAEIYYFVVTIDDIENYSNGAMTVSDSTASIYVYRSKYIDGSKLSATDIAVGDLAILSGTLKNYKGLLEIMTCTVIDFITPGEDEVVPPSGGGNTGGDDSGGSGNTGGDGSGNTGSGSGGTVIFPDADDPITSDPYKNVSEYDFYASYKPAVSYMDAYYRTQHGFMSGTIADQDQEPTLSASRPMENGLYVRNSTYIYSADGNTYYVVDYKGDVVKEIYKGGAYIMLDEVAAYVFAFGEPPVNHSASKNTEPYESVWGEYLRVNHTKFSGDTSKYPYEPVLPNISGCGGDLVYYEMDIGTTGTDCDPSYPAKVYNDGSTITRGAARIVYTRYDLDRDGVIEVNETFLFYTYNHYNDFQEYLNYDGGWGEMFGNITGGGTISSKYDYNPTDYVPVVTREFVSAESITVVTFIAYIPERKYV